MQVEAAFEDIAEELVVHRAAAQNAAHAAVLDLATSSWKMAMDCR